MTTIGYFEEFLIDGKFIGTKICEKQEREIGYYGKQIKKAEFDFILDNIDKNWDWREISCNTFNYTKKLTEYQNQAARIIQHQVKHWLYSAPNGIMFLKHVKQLQNDGYII